MIKINIKWGKETLKDVEVDPSQQGLVLKSQLYALTTVPVPGQKVLIKGKQLKDDDDLSKFALKDNMTIMLMGTAEGKGLVEPEKPIVFFEDMTPEEKAAALNQTAAVVLCPGLENLGNTCYMASTVQMLRRVGELKDALKELNKGQSYDQLNLQQQQQSGMEQAWAGSAGRLMEQIDSTDKPFAPYQFVQTMRQAYPMFDDKDEKGNHKQQDADECFQAMLQNWRGPLKNNSSEGSDLLGNLFEVELTSEIKCEECPQEETTTSSEKVLRLSCHIDNNNNPINTLSEGIKISLEGQIEKFSPTLGRNAIYSKTSRINKLPSYLCAQFVRFYWKQASETSGTEGGKAKILRSVSFPRTWDVFEFCSEELRKSLQLGRDFERKQREEEDNRALTNKDGPTSTTTGDVEMKDLSQPESAGAEKNLEESKDEKPRLVGKAAKAALKSEQVKKEDAALYRKHGEGLDTGAYQLVGVVTHKGRSADGGHYIGWVHASGDDWMQCDDDIVTVVKTDDIMALRGGGDWHTAYLALYRKSEVVEKEQE